MDSVSYPSTSKVELLLITDFETADDPTGGYVKYVPCNLTLSKAYLPAMLAGTRLSRMD